MKVRNGFVSNSSSASFVIAFPKDKHIALNDIEEWLGGYNTEIDPVVMDMIGFQFWKTQYFNEEMYRRDFKGTGKEYDFHRCDATWESMTKEVWNCPRYMVEDEEKGAPVMSACRSCKYHTVEKRIDRGDDYYKALDFAYSDGILEWLEKHKDDKIVYFEVDDNDPARGIDYDTACKITFNAYHLFNHKTDNVYCLGGK